jgi:hypothetical protein
VSRSLLARIGRMNGAELRWRSTTAVRNALQQAAARLRKPEWRRHDLAAALLQTPASAPILAALRQEDWTGAHRLLATACIAHPPLFVIAPSMREAVVGQLRATFPGVERDAAARADRLVAGEYDLLGYRALRFDGDPGVVPDWHLDPVHSRRAPLQFWSTVPYLSPECGDHKIIWELNRQQHLLALGRAWWLTDAPVYRDLAVAQITGWIAANPPLTGINWASMLELAFRSLSWIWAVQFFASGDARDEQPWLVDLLLALDRQLTHIEQNLSYYFSPNTHLLGEALALYVAGRTMPLLRRANHYAEVGRRVLVEQATRQVGKDGGHLERSTHYHRYTLDFYLLALAVARTTDDHAIPAFAHVAARLAFAARLLADQNGRIPHIGDDDGGMLLPICGRSADDLCDSLATAAALDDRPDLRIGPAPEEAFWMLAHPALQPLLARIRDIPPADAVASAALPDMGYYVSRSAAGNHLVIDAGAHGYANGGHAHADALSLTLSVRGLPLLIDPGTGCYTTDLATRDRFRSSHLHNTVVVDGRSQSVPSGPFHWAQAARATAHVWRSNPGFDYLEASHDGYAPLHHRRHVLALHGDLLIVADLIEGSGVHDVRVHWHLDPRWSVHIAGRHAVLRAAGERVDLAVSEGLLSRIHGGDEDGVGWHAPVYGRIEATSALRVSASGAAPRWIVSVFGMNPANEVFVAEQIPVWRQAGVVSRPLAIRITRAHSVDVFGLATPLSADDGSTTARQTWRVAGYETDARMLFCRASDSVSRIALVDGSLVRSTDRQAIYVQLPREAPDLHVDLTRPRGSQPAAARVSGPVFGAHVQVAGRDLPVAVERRSTGRGSVRQHP